MATVKRSSWLLWALGAAVTVASCGDDATDPGPNDTGGAGQSSSEPHGGETAGPGASGAAAGGAMGGASEATAGSSSGGQGGHVGGQPLGGSSSGEGGAAGQSLGGAGGGSAGDDGGEAGGQAGAGGQAEIDWCDGSDADACLDSVTGETSDFGNQLKSSWFLATCMEKQGHDCLSVPSCPNLDAPSYEDQGMITAESFPIGGLRGQRYKLTFDFNAVASAKVYSGGTRDAGSTVPADPDTAQHDTFYRDGAPTPTQYDAWKLVVLDPDGIEARHYYMNSFPDGQAYPDGRGYEYHRTYLLSYSKSIVVIGGGAVVLRLQDRNCRAIDNCGPGLVVGDACPSPRTLPNEPNAILPSMYRDPQTTRMVPTSLLNIVTNSALQPWHAQLGHLTITAVEKTTAAVSANL